MEVGEGVDGGAHIEGIGTLMMERLEADCASARLRVCGLPAMFFLQFDEEARERRFLLAAASRGVLIKRGAYNFPSLAHGDSEVTATLEAVRGALAEADA